MFVPTTYEIVVRGRANARLLRPLLDDFSFDHTVEGVTRLIGEVRDAAHLHGVVTHLTSVNVELVSIAPLAPIHAHLHTTNNEWTTPS
ncbi:MAG TPA: hypothetical protein VLD86_18515 [Ilumatobacteraceae bacterium]|nr:hypothetical protein [Ilumatobacteraceae bacterium]